MPIYAVGQPLNRIYARYATTDLLLSRAAARYRAVTAPPTRTPRSRPR